MQAWKRFSHAVVSNLAVAINGAFKVDAATATAAAGAATLNRMAGVVTSEAVTTAAAAAYTLTLTNSKVKAGDIVLATVSNGTNSAGVPLLSRVTASGGSVVFVIQNGHAANAFNGTLKVNYVVLNAS